MKFRSIKHAAAMLAVGGALAAATLPASAHHSFAMYEPKTVTFKGVVKSFQWTNPHSIIWVLLDPQSGGEPQEWSIETTSPGVLTRSGWTRHSLNPGDRVSIEFSPLRDGSHGGGLHSVTLLATGQTLKANLSDSEKPELK
jgi:hypothetical protein